MDHSRWCEINGIFKLYPVHSVLRESYFTLRELCIELSFVYCALMSC